MIIDAQAFGASQEHYTLKPILESIKSRYQRLAFSDDIYKDKVIVTADTGFSNDSNNRYLREEGINAYIPDNQFRSRDPKFKQQKTTYGKRHQDTVKGQKNVIHASEFRFNRRRKPAFALKARPCGFTGKHPRPAETFRSCLKTV